jgi:hypothetical protein
MPVDGLTKALQRQKFNTFMQQLGLVDIKELLEVEALEDCNEESESDFESDHGLVRRYIGIALYKSILFDIEACNP